MRKVIRTGMTEFTYTRTVQPRPKLGAWLGELNRLLEVNAARASRERQFLTQIYEELSGLGYEGGCRSPLARRSLRRCDPQYPASQARSGTAASPADLSGLAPDP